tara:strand:- start:465 stop:1619 length:1155 start_codon:yes stop_codon:yes gene_type:complete
MIKENLNIVEYNTSDLIFAEYNPRELTNQQHQDLKDSITRFGFVDPLIVNINKNRKNILIGGHQRLKIAKELLYKKVPCVEVDLTPEKEKELNVRLNKNTGQWDWDVLANQFEVGDLLEWGFNEDELQFKEPEEIQGLTDDDNIPEVEEAITQPGDLWILGRHRLLCGDATNKQDIKKLMDGQMADIGLTDPPYGVRKKEEWDNENNFINSITEWFYQYEKNCDKGLIWFCADKMLPHLVLNKGFERLLIWNKPPGSQYAGASNNNIWYSNEPILVFDYGKIKKNCGTSKFSYSVFDSRTIPKSKHNHPTVKPIDLLVWLIEHYSDYKQIILDTFLGSGSTLIACEKTNRKCYGMEIDTNYCDVIVKRWEDYTGNKAERIKNAD